MPKNWAALPQGGRTPFARLFLVDGCRSSFSIHLSCLLSTDFLLCVFFGQDFNCELFLLRIHWKVMVSEVFPFCGTIHLASIVDIFSSLVFFESSWFSCRESCATFEQLSC